MASLFNMEGGRVKSRGCRVAPPRCVVIGRPVGILPDPTRSIDVPMGEISRRTWWLMAALVMAVVAVAAFVQAQNLGFWEPWESTLVRADVQETHLEIDEPDEEAEGLDEAGAVDATAVPTLEGEPKEVSWLRAWWTSEVVGAEPVVETGGVGEIERMARIPLIALMVLMFGLAAFWVRRHLGDGAAAMTVVVLATSPVVFVGAVLLSGPLVAVAASALAVMAMFQSVYGDRLSLLWACAGAACLTVVALESRLIGVVSTLAVVVGFALVESIRQTDSEAEEDADGDDESEAGFDPLWAGAAAVGFVGVVMAGVVESADYEEGLLRPDLLELTWVIGPAVLLVGLALAARHTPMGRALVGLRGAIVAAGGIIPLVALGVSYAGAVVGEPEVVEAGRPALGFLLETYPLAQEVEATGDFSWWWRQIGFGMFPHMIWLIPAVGFLAWKLRPDSGADEIERAVATLCLVWPVAVYIVVAPAADLGHTTYPAFFPIALAIGWMLSDARFWAEIRVRPAIYLAVATVAIFTVVILTNDLEDFPQRLVAFALDGAEDPGVPDRFVDETAVEAWGTAMMAGVAAYFVGIVSWLVFARRDAARLWTWIRGVASRARARLSGDDEDEEPADAEDEPEDEPSESDAASESDTGFAGERRLRAREEWRDEDGALARLAGRLERLPGLVGLVVAGGLGFSAVLFGSVVGDLDDELSTRAVVERYLESADEDDQLWWYEVDDVPEHFYTRGVDEIDDRREFNDHFESDDRLFALVPEDELDRVHGRVRRTHDRAPVVLATGGGLALVTDRLEDGETDVNPISDYVLDEEPDDRDFISLETTVDGETHHPTFDDRITFLGYSLDRGGPGQRPVYSWGDTMEVTQYFRVERRIPRDYEIFIHIDLGGNRIHGDHDPVGGLYPTNRWRSGDVIKNVHEIEIERFVAPGLYTFYTGFYSGDDRMSVDPDGAHDGEDRVDMAEIEVVAF